MKQRRLTPHNVLRDKSVGAVTIGCHRAPAHPPKTQTAAGRIMPIRITRAPAVTLFGEQAVS